MHQIQIDDQLYAEASRRVVELGFLSVDAYIIDLLQQDVTDVPEDLNYLFTPERLAAIVRAAAEIDAGKGIPLEQVREHLMRKLDTDRSQP